MVNYLFTLVRLCFYPMRIIWTAAIYPLYIKSGKTALSPTTQTVISYLNPTAKTLHLYIPGRNDFNLKNYPTFLHEATTTSQIETLPPKCYSHPLYPLDIKEWAADINHRAEQFVEGDASKQVYIWGYSLGGLATGLAFTKRKSCNINYNLINTPTSIPSLLAHKSTWDILFLTAHLAPTSLILLFLSTQFNQLLLASIILSAISLSIFISCQIYLHKDDYYIALVYKMKCYCFQSLSRIPKNLIDFVACAPCMPYQQSAANHIVCIPILILKLIASTFLLIYFILLTCAHTLQKSIHLVAHIFSYIILWLMNSHHTPLRNTKKHSDTEREPLVSQIQIFQSSKDPLIPHKARASTCLEGCSLATIHLINADTHGFSDKEYSDSLRGSIKS